MAKKKEKDELETTLVFAYDQEGKIEVQDVFVFLATHEPFEGHFLPSRMAAAFTQWASTPEGKKYVEDEGCNWGDATYIPDEFLRKHGIHKYESAEEFSGPKRTLNVAYDWKVVVDHGEPLVNGLDLV